jgi:outer membrane lipoprotein SlyB
MKKVIIAAMLAATILPAKAQLFSRDALGGAVLGGVAGGIIGHNSGGRTAEGIGLGAGAGLLLGALTSNYRQNYYRGPYSSDYYYGDGYYSPRYYSRPNYAVSGALLGGVAGGIIGHNNGRHTAEGIAIGAGAGLLMGGIAEYELRKRERLSSYHAPRQVNISAPATVLTTTPVITQAAQQPAPQQVTVVHNHQGASSPMSSANALFGR